MVVSGVNLASLVILIIGEANNVWAAATEIKLSLD